MGAAARDDIAIAHQILIQTNKLTIRHVINFVKLICKLLWDGINHILKRNLLFRVCVHCALVVTPACDGPRAVV